MESKELLEKVIKKNLETVLNSEVGTEQHVKAHKEAMEGIDRCIELDKMEEKKTENKLVKYLEIFALPVALILVKGAIDYGTKWHFAKKVCQFEVDHTFVTPPGRSISSWFKW